jgi:hypothetical protein
MLPVPGDDPRTELDASGPCASPAAATRRWPCDANVTGATTCRCSRPPALPCTLRPQIAKPDALGAPATSGNARGAAQVTVAARTKAPAPPPFALTGGASDGNPGGRMRRPARHGRLAPGLLVVLAGFVTAVATSSPAHSPDGTPSPSKITNCRPCAASPRVQKQALRLDRARHGTGFASRPTPGPGSTNLDQARNANSSAGPNSSDHQPASPQDARYGRSGISAVTMQPAATRTKSAIGSWRRGASFHAT